MPGPAGRMRIADRAWARRGHRAWARRKHRAWARRKHRAWARRKDRAWARRKHPAWARRERGFALLIVLWTLALLSLLISQLTGSGRQAMLLAGNLRTRTALQAVADGAVHEAAFHLAAAGAAHWPADGALREWRADGAAIRVRILNQSGKVNPSVASLELLAAMLHGCGADLPRATAIAASMASWRFPAAPGNDAAPAYRQAGRDYAPPGQPFESIGEIGLVLGMTPELLACLAPHLSLYRDSDPDPNAADPQVLQAIAEATGATPQRTVAPADESLVAIAVTATDGTGARASRRAVLRFAQQPTLANGAAVPFRVMDWGR